MKSSCLHLLMWLRLKSLRCCAFPRLVMVDVAPHTFNITAEIVEAAITPRTKAIVPVHLFGQSCDMEPIMEVARRHQLWVVEDNAQAIGADYTNSEGHSQKQAYWATSAAPHFIRPKT